MFTYLLYIVYNPTPVGKLLPKTPHLCLLNFQPTGDRTKTKFQEITPHLLQYILVKHRGEGIQNFKISSKCLN